MFYILSILWHSTFDSIVGFAFALVYTTTTTTTTTTKLIIIIIIIIIIIK